MPGNIPLRRGSLMPDIADALFEDRCGTIIALEITAGAKTDSFPAGYHEWRKTIGCRVTAPAIGGKANHAILSLLSEKLDIPAAMLSIQSGTTSSKKRVLVAGMSKPDLLHRLKSISEW
jgi:uncharacterized protein (TIGR00251 family)